MNDDYIYLDKKKISVKEKEQQLLQLLIDNKVSINHSCGGFGTCGTCRVIVSNHELLPPRNPIEAEMANDRGFAPNERLACQSQALPDLIIKLP